MTQLEDHLGGTRKEDENEKQRHKRINFLMKVAHELKTEEESNVVPITNKAITGGFRRDNWLVDLPVGTNFLTYNGGMFLTEWTIMGRRGTPLGTYVLLREDILKDGLNMSSCKWTNSYLFTLDKELKEIL